MKHVPWLLVSLLAAVGGCRQPTYGPAGQVASPTTSETWKFDDAPAGKLPLGWQNVRGSWQVVAEPTARSPKNALAQVAAEQSGSYFNLVVAPEPPLQDVTITVHYRAVAGREDQGGGPVWRYQDQDNYYVARENPLEGNLRVYKVTRGRRIQLGSANVQAPAGKWHELEVTMIGDKIECSLNGKKHLDVKDATFKGAGRVGLWTKADAQTQFDDLHIQGRSANPREGAAL